MFPFFRKIPKGQPVFFHNTLSGKKEEFSPLSRRAVRLYSCGPTVYDHVHIGNLRSFLLSDLIRRVLEYNGYRVVQIMNITDFGHLVGDGEEGDDKMTLALARENLPLTMDAMAAVGEKYAKSFFESARAFNLLPAAHYPRASAHIPAQIALVKTLLEKGYAYALPDGIYFDTSRFPAYGKLGNINLEGLREGARVERKAEKRNPTDFTLWKLNASFGWDAPWGKGFPGWHIECSAMAMQYLGKSFDIHTGGIDHIPTHHNNEIAQSEAATGKPFARYWLHNAFITIEGSRIGKSQGNAILLHNITDRGFSPLSLRFWYLGGHYRTPMNFTWEALEGAHTAWLRILRTFVEDLPKKEGMIDLAYQEKFFARINDDLDTPGALVILGELLKDTSVSKEDKRATLLSFDAVLGIGLSQSVEDLAGSFHLKVLSEEEIPETVRELMAKRERARGRAQWSEADALRADMEKMGYKIEDTPAGPRVRKM